MLEFKPLTKSEDLKYQLQTLASYEKDQLEDTEIEVCYEDKNGMEGFVSVELMDLGSRALERIDQLEKEIVRLSDFVGGADRHLANRILES